MYALVSCLKSRETKQNIDQMQQEFNEVRASMTGKMQMVPLWKINKMLDEIQQ